MNVVRLRLELITFFGLLSTMIFIAGLAFYSIPKAHGEEGSGADTGGGNAWTLTIDEQQMEEAIDRARVLLPFHLNFLLSHDWDLKESFAGIGVNLKPMSEVKKLLVPESGKTIFDQIKENRAEVKDQCFERIEDKSEELGYRPSPVDGSQYFLVNGELVKVPGKYCISFNSISKGKVDQLDLFNQILGLSLHEYIHLQLAGEPHEHEYASFFQGVAAANFPRSFSNNDPFSPLRDSLDAIDAKLIVLEEAINEGIEGFMDQCIRLNELQVSTELTMGILSSNWRNFVMPTSIEEIKFLSVIHIVARMTGPYYCHDLYGRVLNRTTGEDYSVEFEKRVLGNLTKDWEQLRRVDPVDLFEGHISGFPDGLSKEPIELAGYKDIDQLKEVISLVRKYFDLYKKAFEATKVLE